MHMPMIYKHKKQLLGRWACKRTVGRTRIKANGRMADLSVSRNGVQPSKRLGRQQGNFLFLLIYMLNMFGETSVRSIGCQLLEDMHAISEVLGILQDTSCQLLLLLSLLFRQQNLAKNNVTNKYYTYSLRTENPHLHSYCQITTCNTQPPYPLKETSTEIESQRQWLDISSLFFSLPAFAFRECGQDGVWLKDGWTNYSQCLSVIDKQVGWLRHLSCVLIGYIVNLEGATSYFLCLVVSLVY